MSLEAEILDKLSALLGRRDLTQQQVQDWWYGTADGGPLSDGMYPFTDSTGHTRLEASPAKIFATVDQWIAPAQAAAAAAAASAARLKIVGKRIAASPYVLTPDDDGLMLIWDKTSTLSVRIPPTLAEFWSCGLLQVGSGKIQPVALTGAGLINDQGYIRTRAPGSQANLFVYANVGGSAAQAVLGGSVIA